MACGTGKTLVALWAAEQAKPKDRARSGSIPHAAVTDTSGVERADQLGQSLQLHLCFSDKTVGLKDDSLNMDKSEAGFPIDTDPKIVRQFLERQTDDIKIVFCTYQSAEVVGKAMQPGRGV